MERDLAKGDYGSARRRLESRLSSQGYDPQLLERLGRICLDMRDPFNAGRYWLTANCSGRDVGKAVRQFVEHAGPNPEHVVSRLPNAVRRERLQDYPARVQERLRVLGLSESIPLRRPRNAERATSRLSWSGVVCSVLVSLLIVCIVTRAITPVHGCGRLFVWLLGDTPGEP